MARIFLMFVIFVVVNAALMHHPKFRRSSEDKSQQFTRVACSSESERLRSEFIENSRCRAPKDVFVYLDQQVAHQQISPGAVWVKRCVGDCDYDKYGANCVALKKVDKLIPIRIYDVKTEKEFCSTYAVEEHEQCGCCKGTPESCVPLGRRVFEPRKYSCRCPNRREKRNCRSKRSHRFNESDHHHHRQLEGDHC